MKKKFLTLLLSVLVLALPIISYGAGTASVNLSPPSGEFVPEKNFSVNIGISPNGQNFDTARIVLKYPASLLEITSFSFGPAFSIPSGENNFDNSAGIFTYGAGIPEGASENTLFGTITFSPKSEGDAIISLDSESLILSAGENIFNGVLASAPYALKKPLIIAEPKTIKAPPAVNKNPVAENKIEQSNLVVAEPEVLEPEVVPIIASALPGEKTQTASIFDAAKKFISANLMLAFAIILALLILLGSVFALNINGIKKHEN